HRCRCSRSGPSGWRPLGPWHSLSTIRRGGSSREGTIVSEGALLPDSVQLGAERLLQPLGPAAAALGLIQRQAAIEAADGAGDPAELGIDQGRFPPQFGGRGRDPQHALQHLAGLLIAVLVEKARFYVVLQTQQDGPVLGDRQRAGLAPTAAELWWESAL